MSHPVSYVQSRLHGCTLLLDGPLITEGADPHVKVWYGMCPHRSMPTGLQPTAELEVLHGGKHRGQPSLALDYGRRHLASPVSQSDYEGLYKLNSTTNNINNKP